MQLLFVRIFSAFQNFDIVSSLKVILTKIKSIWRLLYKKSQFSKHVQFDFRYENQMANYVKGLIFMIMASSMTSQYDFEYIALFIYVYEGASCKALISLIEQNMTCIIIGYTCLKQIPALQNVQNFWSRGKVTRLPGGLDIKTTVTRPLFEVWR